MSHEKFLCCNDGGTLLTQCHWSQFSTVIYGTRRTLLGLILFVVTQHGCYRKIYCQFLIEPAIFLILLSTQCDPQCSAYTVLYFTHMINSYFLTRNQGSSISLYAILINLLFCLIINKQLYL